MELFETIRAEHKEMIEAVDRLIGSEPDESVDALGRLIAMTLTHMSAEEHSVYPALEGLDDVYSSVVLRNEEEHYLARSVLNELLYKGLDYDHRSAKLRVFRTLVRWHMAGEEKTVFDAVADNFTEEEIAEIARRYGKIKAELTGDYARAGPLIGR